MNPCYRKTYTLSAIHLDANNRLKPSALLLFAQEAAGEHCVELTLDWQTLAKQNLFWAVLRHKVEITRLPTAGETITIETWPMPTTRTAFPRATVGYDAQGRELFRAVSLWVLMNPESRTMVLPEKSGIVLNGILRGNELMLPSSIVPKTLSSSVLRKVRYSQLDRNGHMNNTCYLDWVSDLLPREFHRAHPMQSFSVCYLSECLENQEIALNWQILEGDCLQVEGFRPMSDNPKKQERVFAAQIYF